MISSKFVAWFDVQKRASTLGGANKKRDHQRWSLFLFSLFPRCPRPSDTHLQQLAPTQLELTGRIAFAILLNLARLRDKFVNHRVSL